MSHDTETVGRAGITTKTVESNAKCSFSSFTHDTLFGLHPQPVCVSFFQIIQCFRLNWQREAELTQPRCYTSIIATGDPPMTVTTTRVVTSESERGRWDAGSVCKAHTCALVCMFCFLLVCGLMFDTRREAAAATHLNTAQHDCVSPSAAATAGSNTDR